MSVIRRRSLLSLCLVAPLVFVTGPVRSPDEIAEACDRLASAALEQPGAVGFSVAIGWGDRILLEKGYGLAEVEHGAKADGETVFRIGSISKQFTAAAVMRLVEQGKVELDADMNTYLPDYPTQGHTVTVRHLLTHTSGIVSYTGIGEAWQKTVPLELEHSELLDFVEELPFEFEPGTRWRYNNTGYYLLGMLVEAVTEKSYADYMKAEFFGPLGLTRTRYGSNVDVIPNRAQGYQLREGELKNDDLIGMSQPGAAGALIATARDLVAWQIALIGGKVVSPESYTAMATPAKLNDGAPTGYGFGLGIGDFEGRARVSHGGGINGFNSFLAYFPEDELSVAVISNSEAVSSQRLADEIVRTLLGL